MLKLLVPVLVNGLLEGFALKEANKYSRALNEHCLQSLMVIGPQYPEVVEHKVQVGRCAGWKIKIIFFLRNSKRWCHNRRI